jgi:hypothetical protein
MSTSHQRKQFHESCYAEQLCGTPGTGGEKVNTNNFSSKVFTFLSYVFKRFWVVTCCFCLLQPSQDEGEGGWKAVRLKTYFGMEK